MKVCSNCGNENFAGEGINRCKKCREGKTKNARKNRAAIDSLMADMGLVKVKGAKGGIYWE